MNNELLEGTNKLTIDVPCSGLIFSEMDTASEITVIKQVKDKPDETLIPSTSAGVLLEMFRASNAYLNPIIVTDFLIQDFKLMFSANGEIPLDDNTMYQVIIENVAAPQAGKDKVQTLRDYRNGTPFKVIKREFKANNTEQSYNIMSENMLFFPSFSVLKFDAFAPSTNRNITINDRQILNFTNSKPQNLSVTELGATTIRPTLTNRHFLPAMPFDMVKVYAEENAANRYFYSMFY